LERIEGQPIVDWDPGRSDRQIDTEEAARWKRLETAVIDALRALEKIQPATLKSMNLPPLPYAPHGMRRWMKKGVLDMKTAVLGNGAFEIKNFWRDKNGLLVVMDNEFAGWYPKYDHLAYLYHRLYCNSLRPDLARNILNMYRIRCMVPAEEPQFFRDFCRILRPRVAGGWYYDAIRRRLPPWHRKQKLRYRLLWDIARKSYRDLYAVDFAP
jgi:hypothetical protein